MADEITLRMQGLPEFKSRLAQLSKSIQKNVVRSGTLAASNVFKKAAAADAPILSKPDKRRKAGTLRRAIYVIRSKRASRDGIEVFKVTVRQGAKERGRGLDAFYWRWVENGYLARGRRQKIRGGSKTKALARERLKAKGAKFIAGKHFLQRAFQSRQKEAINAFNTRLEARIVKANKELNGR